MLPAPPPPAPAAPAQRGTPFLHCAAGASVWYVAIITVNVVIGLRTGHGLDRLGGTILFSAVPFAITTVLTWLILLRIRIKPWVLIFLTLPLYVVVSLVVALGSVVVGAVFGLMVR